MLSYLLCVLTTGYVCMLIKFQVCHAHSRRPICQQYKTHTFLLRSKIIILGSESYAGLQDKFPTFKDISGNINIPTTPFN